VCLAAAGETVLISDRDQVVAQLGPPEARRSSEVADVMLADAVRRGLVTPAALPPGDSASGAARRDVPRTTPG
jgi:antitoxin (DNA-binding transcriptional repressor) of toxin-antitoxin stability system